MLIPTRKNQRLGDRKRTIDRPLRLGKVSARFVMTGLMGALALLYLAQSTQNAARSYQLRALLEQRDKLQKEVDRLTVESIRLGSLAEIQKMAPPPDPTKASSPSAWEPVSAIAYPATAEPVAQRP